MLFSCIFLATALLGNDLKTIWNRLDPKSLDQALAFHLLYPDSKEGIEAKKRAARLLGAAENDPIDRLIPFLHSLKSDLLSTFDRDLILKLGSHLPNRKLKGYFAKSQAEILSLPSEEIDIGRALLLSQLDGKSDALEKTENYSALLDLMALQILSDLPKNASPREKIEATNHFLFEVIGFRFPPHSIYSKEIDVYTFLPSVMDNHLGVCLGVTAMYLAIAQRIDLPLESITPPGHIYVRYRDEKQLINIETTARGIDTPTETYLGVNTYDLQARTLKEVVGMTHVNQGSLYLQNGLFKEALACYDKAHLFLPDDPLVKELKGFCCCFSERVEEGRKLLEEVKNVKGFGAIAKSTMIEDFLEGRADEEGIKTLFMMVDETRESILKKQKKLLEILEKYPEFKEGWEHLGITWIQLHRPKEALEALLKREELGFSHPAVNYYLSVLHGEREDYAGSWHYLKKAEALTAPYDFSPKALKEVRQKLLARCPE